MTADGESKLTCGKNPDKLIDIGFAEEHQARW